jgi:hypothetical protein
MARFGVPVGGRVKKLRAVEDQSAPIPREVTSELGGIYWMDGDRSMRAVKGSLGHSLKLRYRESEGLRSDYWHVTGNRLQTNRRVGRVKNIC